MNIWFFHPTATPLNMSGMHRPALFGHELAASSDKVTVFSSSFLHYSRENLINDKTPFVRVSEDDIDYVFVRSASYMNSGKDRVKNMIQFASRVKSVACRYAKEHGKPDVIIASSPHPLSMYAGIKTAKKLKVPCICEVRDFWPEVIFLSGRLSEKSLFGRALVAAEHRIYKAADAMIFLKPGDTSYITDHGWDTEHGGNIDLKKCFYVNNGINLDMFNTLAEENKTDDADLDSGKFIVTYAGSIRPVNNIGNILDCAKIIGEKHDDVEFLLYGDGDMVDEMNRRIQDENISNVKLKGYVHSDALPNILSRSSVNLLNYTTSHYNWSRGNSSNKLFEYMAAGRPVVANIKMGYDPIDQYGCGTSVADSSPKSLADAIIAIKECERAQYDKMCQNAKSAAADFDYSVLTQRLREVIAYAVGRKKRT